MTDVDLIIESAERLRIKEEAYEKTYNFNTDIIGKMSSLLWQIEDTRRESLTVDNLEEFLGKLDKVITEMHAIYDVILDHSKLYFEKHSNS